MNHEAKSAKLLIVDDMPANIKVLVQCLHSTYRIIVATDGLNALELVMSEKPDLILLDIMMPGMDGYEVCRKLKVNRQVKDIPIIFITAKDDVEDEAKGLELGAVDYITKPFSIPIVLARVKTHLRLKKAREVIAAKNKELLEADRLKEDVNRIMRHDLKGPLNAIIGFSSLMLADSELEQEKKESLEIISSSGYLLLTMIDQSLDLYKMEQKMYELKPICVNIFEIFKKIIKSHARAMTVKHLDIQLVSDCGTNGKHGPFVLGEELLCYSLFANLMKNAVEASPANREVRVHMKNGTDHVEVAIHNHGEVPEQIKDRFFEKYVTSGKTHGTGLGTYSARLMAQTQNGSIHFTSSRETGTIVTVQLPVFQGGGGHMTG
ncbi:MAG: hybrid sensor histidine kinase/response regulator [Magnetococcales bacterium]|nr:hybrid sensor histidine kinase/response regulator [Magnetococcales bacterium]